MKPLRLAALLAGLFTASIAAQSASPEVTAEAVSPEALPRLVDVGATRCVPCRMMAPILDALREEYAGVVSVEFIDVMQSSDQANALGVQIIPTQIFFDAQGNEVLRHQGFMPREDILAQFEAMGIAAPQSGSE